MYILGISCFYHDAAAAVLCDGKLIAAAEEERFTRKKHDIAFPINAIDFCLKKAGIDSRDLDYCVFYEKPFLKFERILMSFLQTFPKSCRFFREAMSVWFKEKLWIKNIIQDSLKVDPKKILFVEHHLSHAASAFFCSPFRESCVITVDGVGEWTTATSGLCKENSIRFFKEMRFPHSLGLLYSAFTAFLGFQVNEGEYKVMGMAPYGKPRYAEKIRKICNISDDGSFWHDMSYFSYHYSVTKTFNSRFEKLFGTPRNPKDKEKLDPYYADLAASIQLVTEEILLKMTTDLYKQTGIKKLCLAGGVALNSVANGRVLRETPFEEIFVQPAAGDSGGALGAALYTYHALLGKPKNFIMEHAFWGEEYSENGIYDFLKSENVQFQKLEDFEDLTDRVVDRLCNGKVVGWMQGRFEWGPRALGHRSILADPRDPRMKDIVNAKIKFREPFRPFAPSVLAEETERFFELPEPHKHYPARFMLLVVPVREDKRDVIPAVTHVDGTARPQMVDEKTDAGYYRLIKKFRQATGVPVLLNTSFNLKGEPIVNTPEDAFSTFQRSRMDTLVLGNFMVDKNGGKQ